MSKEKNLSYLQIQIGIFSFFLLLIVNSITEEWMNCLNPEVIGSVIVVFRFCYSHKEFIGSILNPISITMLLTGLVSLQNLKIKRKQAIKEQMELLLWCKCYLIMIHTPEELSEKIQIKDLEKSRIVSAELQKDHLERLLNAINNACLSKNWDDIEADIEEVKINFKVIKTLRQIEAWAQRALTACQLMITANIATAKLDMICPKPWLIEINKVIEEYIEMYYRGKEKEMEIIYFKNQWKEREEKVNESKINIIL